MSVKSCFDQPVRKTRLTSGFLRGVSGSSKWSDLAAKLIHSLSGIS